MKDRIKREFGFQLTAQQDVGTFHFEIGTGSGDSFKRVVIISECLGGFPRNPHADIPGQQRTTVRHAIQAVSKIPTREIFKHETGTREFEVCVSHKQDHAGMAQAGRERKKEVRFRENRKKRPLCPYQVKRATTAFKLFKVLSSEADAIRLMTTSVE